MNSFQSNEKLEKNKIKTKDIFKNIKSKYTLKKLFIIKNNNIIK